MLDRVVFTPEGLKFERYPFRGASVRKRPLVPLSAIAEVLPLDFPPAILTQDGEFLFLSAEHRQPLIAWARTHGLPLMNRRDPWGWLLNPFLDTEFSEAEHAQDLVTLAEMGIPPEETARWRKRVEPRMMALTAATWEWVDYGLFDLLWATRSFSLSDGWLRPQPFYDAVMEVARRGGSWPASEKDLTPPPTPVPADGEPAGALEVRVRDAQGRSIGPVFVSASTGANEDCDDGGSVDKTGERGSVRWTRLKPGRYRIFATDMDLKVSPSRYWRAFTDVTAGETTTVTLDPTP